MNQITTRPETAVAKASDADLINVLRSSLYPGAKPESIALVLGYCRSAGLDPMLKPVHIVPMWDSNARVERDVIMPGIGHYRVQASRSGQYVGKSEPEFGPDVTEKLSGVEVTYPVWCRVTVKRLIGSEVADFTVVERWKENYATAKRDTTAPNAMWKKRPYGQLAKVAEAQALRQAFPELIGGETAEEMEGKEINLRDVTPVEPQAPTKAEKGKEKAKSQLDGFAGVKKEDPPPAAIDGEVLAALPEPPEAVQADIREGKALGPWKWWAETVMTLDPLDRQAFADAHEPLIATVRSHNDKWASTVTKTLKEAGVELNARETDPRE